MRRATPEPIFFKPQRRRGAEEKRKKIQPQINADERGSESDRKELTHNGRQICAARDLRLSPLPIVAGRLDFQGFRRNIKL